MFVLLKNRALLKVSGSDAETFLQGQLSNDINKLDAFKRSAECLLSASGQDPGIILGN